MVLRWKGGGPVATKSMENLVFLLSYSPSPLFSSLLWLLWFSDRDQLFTLHWYNAGITCIVYLGHGFQGERREISHR